MSSSRSTSAGRPHFKEVNDSLYELYAPPAGERPTVELFFFHGLYPGPPEDAFWKVWTTCENECWPETYLKQEHPGARVLLVTYDASVHQTNTSGRLDLHNLGENLVGDIICSPAAGTAYASHPIVLVAHSVGGLVVKQMILHAQRKVHRTDSNPRLKIFLDKLQLGGIFYFSTPHAGADIRNFTSHFSLESPVTSALSILSVPGARLNEEFRIWRRDHRVKAYAVAERDLTRVGRYSGLVVEEASAKVDVDDFSIREGDHFTICAPRSPGTSSAIHSLMALITESSQRSRAATNASNQIPEKPNRKLPRAADIFYRAMTGTPVWCYILLLLLVPLCHFLLISYYFSETSKPVSWPVDEVFNSSPPSNYPSNGNSTSNEEWFSNDSRYVPRQNLEAKIRELNNATGPAVVLLHGGPGTGKSMLARNLYVQYMYHKQENRKFDHVCFLNCGPHAKIEYTQVDIIRCLDSEPLSREDKNELIEIQLKDLLTMNTQGVLLILDDVSNGDFLQDISNVCMHGKEVKILVTSQDADLCRSGLDSTKYIKIPVQDIDLDTARKILASHIGLQNQQIPHGLQGLADKMIKETDLNPLALASLANLIDPRRADELGEWEAASNHFLEALKVELDIRILQDKYPRSFWATMRLAIDALMEDAKKLLVLTQASVEPSVPEEVVKVLYKSAQITHASLRTPFSEVRRKLENLDLIKITKSSSNISKHRWSMHSLQRLYIKEEMRELRNSILNFTKLLVTSADRDDDAIFKMEEGNEEQVVIALCALYLEGELAERAWSKMVFVANAHDVQYNFVIDRRSIAHAIEPITLLLGRSVSDQWTKTARRHAVKVFLMYVCNKQALDDNGISHLLGLPNVTLHVSNALQKIWLLGLDDFNFVNKSIPNLKKTLVVHLEDGVETHVQMAAIEVLFMLASSNEYLFHHLFIGGGALDGIVRLLGRTSDPTIQMYCGEILRTLVTNHYGDIKSLQTLMGCKGFLDSLVTYLSKDYNPRVQEHAIETLRNLVHLQPNQSSIQDYAATFFSAFVQVKHSDLTMTIKAIKSDLEGITSLLDSSPSMHKYYHCLWQVADALISSRRSDPFYNKHAHSTRVDAESNLTMQSEIQADREKAPEELGLEELWTLIRKAKTESKLRRYCDDMDLQKRFTGGIMHSMIIKEPILLRISKEPTGDILLRISKEPILLRISKEPTRSQDEACHRDLVKVKEFQTAPIKVGELKRARSQLTFDNNVDMKNQIPHQPDLDFVTAKIPHWQISREWSMLKDRMGNIDVHNDAIDMEICLDNSEVIKWNPTEEQVHYLQQRWVLKLIMADLHIALMNSVGGFERSLKDRYSYDVLIYTKLLELNDLNEGLAMSIAMNLQSTIGIIV